MQVRYWTIVAIASILGWATTHVNQMNPVNATSLTNSTSTRLQTQTTLLAGNPCAGKANPCAAKSNPCAGKANPCAGKANPCAGKSNPCAGKSNPCAGKANPCAAKKTSRAPEIYMENGVAIRGTDPVAYFKQGKVVVGSPEFEYQWQGATWRFSSAQNRALFAQNPQQFTPQYGGYCAMAVSEGNLAPTDPNAWKIVNGKLYLNYDKSVQAEWQKDIPGRIALGDRNWPQVLEK